MAADSGGPRGGINGNCATGVEGLDDILRGGFTRNRLYLIEGVPGSGKTTLALQFLLEGAKRGEPVLYVTMSESEIELREVSASHGWSLDGITVRELVPSENSLRPEEQYTMFHPSEVELSETMKTILADVERIKPLRVVFDSLSELRLLASNPLRFRRQILALKQFFGGRNCTVLLLDDLTSGERDLQVQSIAHGVVRLECQRARKCTHGGELKSSHFEKQEVCRRSFGDVHDAPGGRIWQINSRWRLLSRYSSSIPYIGPSGRSPPDWASIREQSGDAYGATS